ncbi:hypothetical protein E4T44_06095 [Aureobasidium sp. EXF-8845]|nr:hypothetical protein E4T44_06095 [Aureobasidium sp. EXF-8845]
MSSFQPQNYLSARRKSTVLTNSQDHLWGIRAILAVQSFAWLFFKVFNPALTIPSATPTGEHVPDASPSTVPGVFGGPGIVGPGADSGIIRRDVFARDLYARNLANETSERCGEQFERRNIGEMLQRHHARQLHPIPSQEYNLQAFWLLEYSETVL